MYNAINLNYIYYLLIQCSKQIYLRQSHYFANYSFSNFIIKTSPTEFTYGYGSRKWLMEDGHSLSTT